MVDNEIFRKLTEHIEFRSDNISQFKTNLFDFKRDIPEFSKWTYNIIYNIKSVIDYKKSPNSRKRKAKKLLVNFINHITRTKEIPNSFYYNVPLREIFNIYII